MLASVNGKPITLNDILPYTRNSEYRAYASNSGKALEREILSIRREAVDRLIDRELILADYAGQRFEITHRDIENALDETAERMGFRSRNAFAARLRQQGSSIEEMRQRVKEHMIVQLMLHRQYTISAPPPTPEMIYNYYHEHYAKKQAQVNIELAMIMLDKKDPAVIKEVSARLAENPDSFAELAAKHTIGPGRENGGNLGMISRDLLRKEFADLITVPEKGKVYGPAETPEGTAFIRVLSFTSGKAETLQKATPEIRKHFEQIRREESRKAYTGRLRQNAIVRYFFDEKM